MVKGARRYQLIQKPAVYLLKSPTGLVNGFSAMKFTG